MIQQNLWGIPANLWVAKDKNGTIHICNNKPIKPSEKYPENTDANDEIFTYPENDNEKHFFVRYLGEIKGLTFENSPKEIELTIKN